MMDSEVIKNCWSFVQMFQRPVLIVEISSIQKVFLCDNFKPKGRDFFQNEVIGGQEITELLFSIEMHQAANNKYALESKIDELPRLDFSFGHDSFTLLKSIR